MNYFKEALKNFSKSFVFQLILIYIFMIPLIATIGQYISSGFLTKTASVMVLFWPGVKWDWSINMPVWLIMGIMALTYIIGILWMIKKRYFGSVVLIGLMVAIIAPLFGAAINHFTGWKELQDIQSMDLAGKTDKAILSLWQNPLWEEIVFRGLPLLLIIPIREMGSGFKKWSEILYVIIPSIITAIYHIPNHGLSRIWDTFLIAVVFAILALRYTLFAPLVLHYIFDAMMIINMGKMKGIPENEVRWLSNNFSILNTSFSIGIVVLIISVPVLIIFDIKRMKKLYKVDKFWMFNKSYED